ncbi:MAG: sulfatase activating formylglycine-generating enzyme [Bradymonadia bacterium]|jgi:formylglycine-generating enzyme required for sulfatase activity
MVYLPAAAFEIGAMDYSPSEYTEPYRAKLTYGFYIDALEVTQSQFREATGTSPAWSSACGDDCPVESVNWFEAATYANRRSQAAGLERCYRLVDCTGDFGTGCPELVPGGEHHQCMGSFRCATAEFVGLQCEGYRLPTEVEWEYAARGGTTDASYAGAIIPAGGPGSEESLARLATIARTAENSAVTFDNAWPCSLIDGMTNGVSCGPGLVGSLQPNAYGLHDMLGNVGEWTHDTPEIDPAQMSGWRCFGRSTIRSTGESSCRRSRVVDRTHYEPSGDLRMLRGGAWFHSAPGVRVPERSWLRTEARFVDVGFRLVRAAVPPG